MSGNDPMLSVLIPVTERYDDPEALIDAYERALSTLAGPYEIIYILDGEYEDTRRTLERLQAAGKPLRVLQLSKSFGEATALTAGFDHARGNVLMTLPAYFQVEPEFLPAMVEALEGNDMVIARRWPRTDSTFNRFQTALFNRLLGMFTGVHFRDLGCSARIFRRSVSEAVPLYGDQHRFMPVLASRQGFRVREIDLPQSSRDSYRRFYRPGVYPRRVLDMLTVFFLIKFTKKPLRFFGLIGSGTATLGGLLLLYLIIDRIVFGSSLGDRPALLLSSLMVVLGVQIFGLGLLGELIIFTHARELKEYSVREIVNDDLDPAPLARADPMAPAAPSPDQTEASSRSA
ncbi:glycosyltransferase [Methylonatrum kenyense]|uniref:glycosyltransferase n=1 Tax=Methylonatrum kenyense TaxID=455253 RepID=UPI0020BDD4FC|nr:glycosyltransferase [Methylonatrum kenyense]MCK8516814.1 glycosyltransferase [Methylonatrum kenyense]